MGIPDFSTSDNGLLLGELRSCRFVDGMSSVCALNFLRVDLFLSSMICKCSDYI